MPETVKVKFIMTVVAEDEHGNKEQATSTQSVGRGSDPTEMVQAAIKCVSASLGELQEKGWT